MHSKLFGVAAAAALLFCTTGCQTVHYTTNRHGGGGQVEQNAPFFLWGLVGEKVVNLNEVCAHGAARWHNQQTFLDGFLGAITLGIYSPRTIFIECAGDAGAQLPPPAAQPSTTASL